MAPKLPLPRPAQPLDETPPEPSAEAAPVERTAMNWVMVLWLVCIIVVPVFAMISYFAGMFYTPRQ